MSAVTLKGAVQGYINNIFNRKAVMKEVDQINKYEEKREILYIEIE